MRRFIVLLVVVAMVMVVVPSAAANSVLGGCPDPGRPGTIGPGQGADFVLGEWADWAVYFPDSESPDRNGDGWVCIALTPAGHGRPGVFAIRTAIDNNLPLG